MEFILTKKGVLEITAQDGMRVLRWLNLVVPVLLLGEVGKLDGPRWASHVEKIAEIVTGRVPAQHPDVHGLRPARSLLDVERDFVTVT